MRYPIQYYHKDHLNPICCQHPSPNPTPPPPPRRDYVFEAKLDCHQFEPTDLSVKFNDHFLIVEAKHEEKEDTHGFVTRQFTRRYRIPKGTKYGDVQCELDNNRILHVAIVKPTGVKTRPVGIPITKINRGEDSEFYIDVHQFAPEEVSARLVDEFVVVEARHEEKPAEGYGGTVQREFVKKCHLPEGAHWDDIICNMSSDGILHVIVPRAKNPAVDEEQRGKPLPIYYNPTEVDLTLVRTNQ
jgi:HSP20 family molecular chaperone IbpA